MRKVSRVAVEEKDFLHCQLSGVASTLIASIAIGNRFERINRNRCST
ncbi:hypothetical protein H6G17_29830 [Chroococcidiopsis sp. FACHB-1243]|nr:hypothetical protein [Chroococcidiopsis sp. [FACHB-1243]]MBD2309627.1 hypothetical protein [Chroococcidiopsis sp. [FACHB-1243]]